MKTRETEARTDDIWVVLLVAAVGGVVYWLHARHFEDIDDAQVDANLSPVGVRINGTVIQVYVNNNQMVNIGDPLVDLDSRLPGELRPGESPSGAGQRATRGPGTECAV